MAMQTGGWGVPTQNNKQGWGGAQQQWRTQDDAQSQYSTQQIGPQGQAMQGQAMQGQAMQGQAMQGQAMPASFRGGFSGGQGQPSFGGGQGQPSFGGGQPMRTQSPYAQAGAGAGAGMRMNSNSGQQSYGAGYAPPWMQQWGQGQPSFGGEYSTQQIGPQGQAMQGQAMQGQAMQGQAMQRGGRPLMPTNPGSGTGGRPDAPRPGEPPNPPGTPEDPALGGPTAPWGTVPTPTPTPGGAQAPSIPWQMPQNDAQWDWFRQNNQEVGAWLPYGQFLQNQQQYALDFNEAQRRWNAESGWRQQSDQFNMGLAGRQQEMAEWQARTAADQWGQQFGWTQTTDQWNRDLSQQQLSQTDWYNRAQIDQARAAMESEAATQRAVAAMQVYGRSQAPTARWVRNW